VTPWQDDWGLNWIVVTIVPEADFMEQINENTRIAALLCLATLGFSSIFGIYASRWIALPIMHLNQAAASIKDGF